MIDRALLAGVRSLLRLRYRVELRGLDAVLSRGRSGILLLPNHPAIIDPVILLSYLYPIFKQHTLADADQVDRPVIRKVAPKLGVQMLPDMRRHGSGVRPQVEALIRGCIERLRQGGNVLLYPSGHAYRSRYEDLRGNSAVERILAEAPQARVILVRTTGLWGSRFSYAWGTVPDVAAILRQSARFLAAGGVFFAPKRRVTIEFIEPASLPRTAGRSELNHYLQGFYNENAPPNTYVPYTRWEQGGVRELPEPQASEGVIDASQVQLEVRTPVIAMLEQLAGRSGLQDGDRLAYDLGLDSLARAELVLWLGREYAFQGDVDSLVTVGDCLLAATGQSAARAHDIRPVPPKWFAPRSTARLRLPPGEDIRQLFLAQAARGPDRVVLCDERSGARTYREVLIGIRLLRQHFAAAPGSRVGIMMPASVAATTSYLAALFADKTPVLLNWTTGSRNMAASLEVTAVQRIVTSKALVGRLESQGIDFAAFRDRFFFLEDHAAGFGRAAKLGAFLRVRSGLHGLRRGWSPNPEAEAAVLLTSGSESLPKAVPLTHVNILTNLRDALSRIDLTEDLSIMAFLPPFHSFGLSVTVILPLIAGLRAVYHPNPTESATLARLIEAYQASVVVGTPTFLAGIARAARPGALDSLRLAVTGAEKCPPATYELLRTHAANALILEGYGITECSPVVAANDTTLHRLGSIGRPMPSVEHVIVDPEAMQPVPTGRPGLLLVRGPSIFRGYLGQVASPFVEYAGQQWYRTGDLVSEEADGMLTFRGRLTRFVKVAGEMISLPAIEATLEADPRFAPQDGPTITVESFGDEHRPEIVLFTTRPADRQEVNALLRAAGLSPLHNIARVVTLEAIPVLGTGKTDYRQLKGMAGSKG